MQMIDARHPTRSQSRLQLTVPRIATQPLRNETWTAVLVPDDARYSQVPDRSACTAPPACQGASSECQSHPGYPGAGYPPIRQEPPEPQTIFGQLTIFSSHLLFHVFLMDMLGMQSTVMDIRTRRRHADPLYSSRLTACPVLPRW